MGLLLGILLLSSFAADSKESSGNPAIQWDTYQSQAMAFSIQNPHDWKVRESGGYGKSVIFSHHISSHQSVFAWVELVEMDYLMGVLSGEPGLQKLFQPGYHKNTRHLDGVLVTQVEGESRDTPKGRLRMIFASRNGRNFKLSLGVPDKALWKEYQPIFETMLSSFKFSR